VFDPQVMESHVIADKPYHSNLLETMTLRNIPTPAVQGHIRLYHLNGEREQCCTLFLHAFRRSGY